MIERMLRNDLSLKRWRRFKSSTSAVVSVWVLAAITILSFTAEFWANNRPIVMKYQGSMYFPVVKEYHPTVFGITDSYQMDYRRLEFENGDWAAWPLVQWDAYESNSFVDNYPSPPTKLNWFGTDDRGRDVFTRLLYGFRYSLGFALGVWFLSYVVGVLFGAISGFYGGNKDIIFSRVVEVIETTPVLLLLITLISIFSPSLGLLIGFTVFFDWTGIFHQMRGQFLQLRRRDFVEAARALGATDRRIIFQHILPNGLTPIVTFSPFIIAGNIYSLAILDYLGFGLQAPTPSWGELMAQAQKWFTVAEWLVWAPCGALVITMTALISIGQAIRDAYDSRTYMGKVKVPKPAVLEKTATAAGAGPLRQRRVRRLRVRMRFAVSFILSLSLFAGSVVSARPDVSPVDPKSASESVHPQPVWKPEFETYLRGLMTEYRLPNLAVELIDKNGAIWQITLGYRDIDRKLAVNGQTLYAIGSTTKAFTGFLLMQLQQQGQLNIDHPVQEYRPDFAVADINYSSTITLRDLMTHSTGVARHDLAWYHRPNQTRESLFAMIPKLEMATAPRSGFIYNNWMWLTAGLVAEKVSGQTWEQLIRDRILIPSHMHATALSVNEVRRFGNYSQPFEVGSLGVNVVPFYDLAPMNPAGGIYSNLDDMAQWVRVHLNGGSLYGNQLLTPEGVEQTHQGSVPMGGGAMYALGWAEVDFGGQKLLTHDGGIDGFAANVSMMPQQGLGVVVLMNASSVQPQAIALRIWQHVTNQPLKDFVRDSNKVAEKQFEDAMDAYPDLPQVPMPAGIAEYLGRFCHAAYPPVDVYRGTKSDELLVTLSVLRSTLYPVGADQFSIRGQYNDAKVISFQRNPAGQVMQLRWKVEQTLAHPIEFLRCL